MNYLDFHQTIEHLIKEYGAEQPYPNKALVKITRKGIGFKMLEKIVAQVSKPNVGIEVFDGKTYELVITGPVEVEVLSEPRRHGIDGDPDYARFMEMAHGTGGGKGWFINTNVGGQYVWARFLEGPNRGDVLTPSLPFIESASGQLGDRLLVNYTYSNGTSYGKTRVV